MANLYVAILKDNGNDSVLYGSFSKKALTREVEPVVPQHYDKVDIVEVNLISNPNQRAAIITSLTQGVRPVVDLVGYRCADGSLKLSYAKLKLSLEEFDNHLTKYYPDHNQNPEVIVLEIV